MTLHRETSLFNQQGTPCDCPIGRHHTIHEFYDLLDEPHPSALAGSLTYTDTFDRPNGAVIGLPWAVETEAGVVVLNRYVTEQLDRDGNVLSTSYTVVSEDRS